jgi:hypothetical protein
LQEVNAYFPYLLATVLADLKRRVFSDEADVTRIEHDKALSMNFHLTEPSPADAPRSRRPL